MTRRVLLVGAGLAHLHLLHALAREPIAGAELMLVSPSPHVIYSGMVPGLVAGRYTLAQCQIALAPLADAAGVRRAETAACGLDASARRVRLADGREAGYDLLSLDCGGVISRDRIPGAREHGLFVRPLEHFASLLDPLLALAAQRALDVVVIGGGAAGVELALALQQRLGEASDRPSRVALVTGGPPPMASHPASVQARVARELARRRITVFRQACASIQAGAIVLDSGARLACVAPLVATGPEAPPWLAGSGLALDDAGFVRTGATLQSVSHPEVLACGDVAARDDAPTVRSGVHAVRAAPAMVANLRRLLAGQPLLPWRPPARTLNLMSCADGRAIVSWGQTSAQGRWAGIWKDHIDRGFVARGGRLTRV